MTGGRNLEFIHVHPCPSVASLIKPFVYRVCSQGGRPLSAELSVTRRIAKLFATTVQDLLKLCHHSRSKTQSVTDCFLVQINHIMKTRFNLFRRAGVFYTEDTATGKQTSLRTRDETEAKSLLACGRNTRPTGQAFGHDAAGGGRNINANPTRGFLRGRRTEAAMI